jgi:cytochrome c oxidase cbb3-type subunit 3
MTAHQGRARRGATWSIAARSIAARSIAARSIAWTAAAALALVACDRPKQAQAEHRARFNLASVDTTRIQPGPVLPREGIGGPGELPAENPYEGNVYAIQEGMRLYNWMNCVNCHAQGGGSIGPPLWDDQWIYGSSPASVAESIIRGRPNGMPAYGARIPEEQVWMLVTYVRSLKPGGGLKRAGSH